MAVDSAASAPKIIPYEESLKSAFSFQIPASGVKVPGINMSPSPPSPPSSTTSIDDTSSSSSATSSPPSLSSPTSSPKNSPLPSITDSKGVEEKVLNPFSSTTRTLTPSPARETPDTLLSFTLLGHTFHVAHLTYLPMVIGFSISSSLLAIINKYALQVFPYPAVLTALQYLTSVAAVLGLGAGGVIEHTPLSVVLLWKFLPAALVFYLSLLTSMNLLKVANVDTFIAFRSCSPILVAIADCCFRAQPWPSLVTFSSLFLIFAGAAGYVFFDNGFTITAYSWAFAYLFTISFGMVYIKHVVHSIKLDTWGLVLYNNFLALLLFPIFFLITGEAQEMFAYDFSGMKLWEPRTVVPVFLLCTFGLAISFFGFACRKAISATGFTVTGLVNKVLTIIINTIVWSNHASGAGIFCLVLSVIGSVVYQQSTLQPDKPSGSGPKPEALERHRELQALLTEEAEEAERQKVPKWKWGQANEQRANAPAFRQGLSRV